jgi:hypothetical protein
MNFQRIHLRLSQESVVFGQQLARKRKTSLSKLVEGFFMAGRNQVRCGKPFSERWAGRVPLRAPDEADRRGAWLAHKHL